MKKAKIGPVKPTKKAKNGPVKPTEAKIGPVKPMEMAKIGPVKPTENAKNGPVIGLTPPYNSTIGVPPPPPGLWVCSEYFECGAVQCFQC